MCVVRFGSFVYVTSKERAKNKKDDLPGKKKKVTWVGAGNGGKTCGLRMGRWSVCVHVCMRAFGGKNRSTLVT